ncbi:MAG: hypothetical protein M1835_003987 [Candelina submexicana]|nr:MAG: hypothetical protein M1835_003987 [Candelina submexicana]
MVTLPYTVYIEDCCKSVRDAAEYATDRYLLYIVRLQRIMEKVDLLSIQQGTESVVEAYVWALKSELDVFTERLPFSLSDSFLLLTQYYTVELYLFQLSLHDPNKNIDPTRPFPWSPWRLEILCAGLMSARSMLGSFLSLPIDAGKAFNNSQWVQLGFALTVASKLSIAATEKIVARETMSYRQSLGISRLLKECILHTGSLATDFVDEHGDRDVFYHYEQRGKRIQAWYESHFPNNADITPIDTHSASSHPSSQNNVPYLPIAQDISGFTDHWTGYPNGDNSISSETYNLEMPQYLPDATIDEIMGDWISYPTNASGSVAASSSLDTQHFNVKAASHLFTAWTT